MWQYEHFSETKQGERKMAEFREVLNTTIETLICPGWETPVVLVSQPGTAVRDKRGCPFVPGLATGTKSNTNWDKKGLPAPRDWRTLLSRLVLPTGTKGPFFFPVSLFSILFLFQLYFYISIKLMYRN